MRKARLALSLLGLLVVSSTAVMPSYADWGDADRINKNFHDIDEKMKANEDYWKKKPGPIQGTSPLQIPGVFQTVGEFRKALSEGKVIKTEAAPCHRRFCIGADTLFNFDEATLTPYAEETLHTLAPMIVKLGAHPVRIEGHTDSEGTDQYNQKLSERRGERVRNWMVQNHFLSSTAVEMVGYGETRPRAPNKKPDGTDNPEGRASNRRVEIIVDTCTKLPEATALAPSSESGAAGTNAVSVDNSGSQPATSSEGGENIPGGELATTAMSNGASDRGEKPLSTVDLSEMLPYSNLFSSEEIKTGFSRIHVRKPLGDSQLAIAVSAPNDFEEKPIELSRDQISQDSIVQIPLVAMNLKGNSNVHLEVRYIRAADDTNLGGFVKSFAQKGGFEVVGRQPGEFNGRQVEDALLRVNDKNGSIVTRLTASRLGDRIFLVSSSCPEKDYSKWKRVFGFAAVSFTPGDTSE